MKNLSSLLLAGLLAAALAGCSSSNGSSSPSPPPPGPEVIRMNFPRADHTATKWIDGRVLIVGGFDDSGNIVVSGFWSNVPQIYNSVANSFIYAGNLVGVRSSHTSTTLANGDVLIAGGQNPSGDLYSAEIYDPSLGTFSGEY